MPRKRRFHDSRRPRTTPDAATPQQVDTKPGEPPKEKHPAVQDAGSPVRAQGDDNDTIEPTRIGATDRA